MEFTPVEKKIIAAIKKGYISNKEIGKELGYSEPTVAMYIHRLIDKYGISKQKRAKLVWEVMK